jgi:Cof subfamily protein (haloacid dehalogenase superfamily)
MINTPQTKPKLIVLDLDGTALNSNNLIPENLKEMLIDFENKGTSRVSLASGRSISSMKLLASDLSLTAPLVTLNGGVIIDPVTKEVYNEKNLTLETYKESLHILKMLKIDFVIFTSFGVYADKPSEITDILIKYTENEIKWTKDFTSIKNPVKILFIPKSKESNSEIKKQTSFLDIDIIESGFSFTEIVPRGVNKGSALKIVADMLEINTDDIIAFGDNENDIEMLQFAGTGVAMGNAPDHVKMEADIVTETNDNDGIYNVLEKLFNPVKVDVLLSK